MPSISVVGTGATCGASTLGGAANVTIGGAAVNLVGDPTSHAGGTIQDGPNTTVTVDGVPIVTEGNLITTHFSNPTHAGSIVKDSNSKVTIGG